jgi:hypothetical protein
MGASVSVAEKVKGNLILNEGSTFLYSVSDPVSYINRYNGNTSNSCAGSQTTRFNDFTIYSPCSDNYKSQKINRVHLIYEGEVVAPYQGKDGKVVYAYRLKKVYATPDQYNPSAPGSVSWTLEGSGWSDDQKLYYLGYNGKDSNVGVPPGILTFPAKDGFPANYDGKHSLIPQYIPSDDPNLGINGEFGKMSKDQIYKVLNSHSINASYFAEIDRPEVVERAKDYSSLTIDKIFDTASSTGSSIHSYIDTESKYTIHYTKRSNGVPITETLDFSNFFNKGPTVFDSPDKDRILESVSIDKTADYDREFQQEAESIEKHRKRLLEQYSGEKIIMKNVQIKGTTIKGKDNLTNIPLVDPKYSLNTDFIFDDAGFSAILREISRTPGVAAWMQEVVVEGGKNIIKTTLFSQYADSDIIPDKTSERSPIPGSEIVRYVSGIIPPAARDGTRNLETLIGRQSAMIAAPQSSGVKYARRKDRDTLLPKFEEARLVILALLRTLIQKDFTVGGATGAVNLEINNEKNSRYARNMFLYSEILRLNIEAMKKAMDARARVFNSGPAYLTEAFQGSMVSKTSEEEQLSNLEQEKYINGLRSAMDKNQDIADRISQASTDATTQFISFIVASGVFVVLASYPVFSS